MVPPFKLDEKYFPPLPGVKRASVTREAELLSPSPRASSIKLVKEVDEEASACPSSAWAWALEKLMETDGECVVPSDDPVLFDLLLEHEGCDADALSKRDDEKDESGVTGSTTTDDEAARRSK